MKTKLLSALTLAGIALASQPAFAADGTINFIGRVTDTTCTIVGAGQGNNFSVTLPTVSTTSLPAAGRTAGRTPFQIVLDCGNSATGTVSVHFEAGPYTDTVTGMLVPEAGGAPNVQIGLLNSDFSEIKVGRAAAAQNSQKVNLDANGKATLPYFAEYEAVNGAAGAGPANTSVIYTIAYE